jgi:hypothetical protein
MMRPSLADCVGGAIRRSLEANNPWMQQISEVRNFLRSIEVGKLHAQAVIGFRIRLCCAKWVLEQGMILTLPSQ